MKRKLLTGLLLLTMAAGSLWGCSGTGGTNAQEGESKTADSQTAAGGEEGEEPGEASGNAGDAENAAEADNGGDQEEKKEITISILERGKTPAEEGTMEDNRWVEYINENSPVKVKWVPVPRTESVAKINALFASDTAPDLVWEYGKGFMDGLLQQGVIQPVDTHVEAYSTAYQAYLQEHPELVPYVTAEDGQMYGITSARTPLTVANYGMWIRQDWLDSLGLETPETMEELYEVAKQFTQNDPDQNGADDTFGISFNYNFITFMKNMYGQSDQDVYVEDGQIKDWNSTEAFRDCFAMIKNMYEEGIIDPEYITDTNYERQRQHVVTGKAGIYIASWNMEAEWRELKTNVPEAVFVPLEAVSTKYGHFGGFQEPPADKMICMNRNASDPQACMEFLDWVLEEGWMSLTYGEEGTHYNLVEGIPQKTDQDKFINEVDYATEYAILKNEVIEDTDQYFRITSAQDELSQEYAEIKGLALETALKNPYHRDVPYLPSSDLSSRYVNEINPIKASIEAKMITDSSYSIEDGVKEIENEMGGLNFEEVLQERQEWYDNNKGLFGQ